MRPTQERVRECLSYKNGVLVWRNSQGSQKAGRPAGNHRTDGYVRIKLDRRLHMAHVLIWIMHHGDIPEWLEVDHRDGNPSNNRIENLRLATHKQNNCNMKLARHSTTGFKGVTKRQNADRWRAYITQHGKRIWLGSFGSPEEAHRAYCEAAERLFGEFARVA